MHRSLWQYAVLLGLCALAPWQGHAQTSLNPDISVIPRFRIESNDGEKLAEGRRMFSRPDFQFEELELAIQAYLNPFARGDVILTLPGPDLEQGRLGIEELYATVLRGLPLDLNLRLGKYRVEFGKLNMVHPHAWPFVTQPLVQERFLGDEGLNDLGLSASILLPTGDLYSRLTLDLLRGNALAGAAGIADTTGAKPLYAASGRLMTFVTLGEVSDLEAGLSGLTGIHDPYHRDRFWYLNGDLKYKYRPSSYTSLTVQAEYLWNTRTVTIPASAGGPSGAPRPGTFTSAGLYVYADYQFFKMFSLGVRYDWSELPTSTEDRAQAVALFLGYYPVEETLGVRFQYQHTSSTAGPAVNLLALQVLFSLGPHRAHTF